jgi:hypothetical protein
VGEGLFFRLPDYQITRSRISPRLRASVVKVLFFRSPDLPMPRSPDPEFLRASAPPW